ncbi:MAG: hypothetical protein IT285_09375 [Bdellovibrionales bacterium]|nr:hypothetical protein [Bdellovibrionales bacterium]
MPGSLVLVPTPLGHGHPLEPVARERLEKAATGAARVVVEELKVARGRWTSWGLPRTAIDNFLTLNEHSGPGIQAMLLGELKMGRDVYLMSDCGLPAFCDPGRELVRACHEAGIRVTATPFPNSVALAVALAGFSGDSFLFLGFPPRDDEKRAAFAEEALREQRSVVVMDTPYRLERLVDELARAAEKSGQAGRAACLACDLSTANERVERATLPELSRRWSGKGEKREFVLVLGPRAEGA